MDFFIEFEISEIPSANTRKKGAVVRRIRPFFVSMKEKWSTRKVRKNSNIFGRRSTSFSPSSLASVEDEEFPFPSGIDYFNDPHPSAWGESSSLSMDFSVPQFIFVDPKST